MSFPRTPVALAQLITRLVWAYLIGFVIDVGLPLLMQSSGEPDFTVTVLGGLFGLLLILPLFIFPAVRYMTWLNRVAAQEAGTEDLARVTAWITVFRFLAGLGVGLGLAGAVFLGLSSRSLPADAPIIDWWGFLLLVASSVVSFKVLGVARDWVETQTARQREPARRAAALSPILPGLTRWVRATQVLSTVSALATPAQAGGLSLNNLSGLLTLLLFLLILEFSLRFAAASARPAPGTPDLTPA